jgi:hypothetical protein
MSKKPSELKDLAQNKERLLLEGWQEDLESYLGYLQFFKYAQVHYPEIVDEFRKDNGGHFYANIDSINYNIEGYKHLTKYHSKVKSDKVRKNALKKSLSKEALAKRIAIRKNKGEKTTLTELAYCFEVDEDTLRSFVKREFNLDWKSYLRKILEE